MCKCFQCSTVYVCSFCGFPAKNAPAMLDFGSRDTQTTFLTSYMRSEILKTYFLLFPVSYGICTSILCHFGSRNNQTDVLMSYLRSTTSITYFQTFSVSPAACMFMLSTSHQNHGCHVGFWVT